MVLFVRQPAADVASAALLVPLFRELPVAPDGSEKRPFPTLRSALAAAPSGALLRIGEGLWRERLQITRPVVLLGRGAGRTRLVPLEGVAPAIEVSGTDRVQLYGLSVEGGGVGVSFAGGAGHRLENVTLTGFTEAALVGRQAKIFFGAGEISEVQGGRLGRGIDLEGGSLEARKLLLINAGRRAIALKGTRAALTELEVSGSSLSALQATDGADVRVLRGTFKSMGGAALYAGGARLDVRDARIEKSDYAVMGFRGANVTVTGGSFTDYRVAGIALVNSAAIIRRCSLDRGGTEAGIAVLGHTDEPVLLVDNRIRDPGPMGIHVTQASVTARGNTVTGARLDHEREMGDGVFAIDSELQLEGNVFRGNAGSGVVSMRTQTRLIENTLIGNGRAGLLLLDRSRATARGNFFAKNATAGVEVSDASRATLGRNRFGKNSLYDVDLGCKPGPTLDFEEGNTSDGPLRRRLCPE